MRPPRRKSGFNVVDGARSQQRGAVGVIVAIESHQGALHMQISTIGLDIAKNVFQVHGIDAAEKVVVRKRLRRRQVLEFFKALPPCLVGIEACATAHHWARLIEAWPPGAADPAVLREGRTSVAAKTDAADAEAICEAVGRPSMRFVPVKSTDQQAALLHHRARDLLVRQRTMLINALRGHLGEFGIIAPVGRHRIADLIGLLKDARDADAPPLAREALRSLIAELHALETRIEAIESVIIESTRRTPSAGGWQAFQASGRSPHRRSPPPLPTRQHSNQAASWPHGSGWCRDNT